MEDPAEDPALKFASGRIDFDSPLIHSSQRNLRLYWIRITNECTGNMLKP
jgi:hypothetical protein